MAMRVRLTGGGEDVYEDEKWVDDNFASHEVNYAYNVDEAEVLRIARRHFVRRAGESTWTKRSETQVAHYRAHLWETVRND